MRRGLTALEVPRADVELDLDLENVEDGVYLWGALVTDHADIGVAAGYRAFAGWDPMTPEVEGLLFEELWAWLEDLRAKVHGAGKTFRAYCYNAGVEGGHFRRLAALAGRGQEIEGFLASDEWVDLLRVFDSQLITGGGAGLKIVCPLAGYRWPVDEPGGAESMLLYETAVGATDDDDKLKARKWLLDYNRGDVEATLALREWMDREAVTIPSIDTVIRMHSNLVSLMHTYRIKNSVSRRAEVRSMAAASEPCHFEAAGIRLVAQFVAGPR